MLPQRQIESGLAFEHGLRLSELLEAPFAVVGSYVGMLENQTEFFPKLIRNHNFGKNSTESSTLLSNEFYRSKTLKIFNFVVSILPP